MSEFVRGERYVHRAQGGEYMYLEPSFSGGGVFCKPANPTDIFVFELDRMLPVKDDRNNRLQLELRAEVDNKIAEGFEVTGRDPDIEMDRGTRKISLNTHTGTVVIKNR